MLENKEELHFDEDTLRKVYEGLLKAGIFGQQAVDAVNQMQNQGILFREKKPKRRGRPPKAESTPQEATGDAWAPKDGPDGTTGQTS